MTFAPKKQFCALQATDLLAYWAYRSECAVLQRDFEEIIDSSSFEFELINCGITVLNHVISPYDLTNLRQTVLRKEKRPVFGIAQLDSKLFAIGPSSAHVAECPFRPTFGMDASGDGAYASSNS